MTGRQERKELGKALTLSNRICHRGLVGGSNVEKPEKTGEVCPSDPGTRVRAP